MTVDQSGLNWRMVRVLLQRSGSVDLEERVHLGRGNIKQYGNWEAAPCFLPPQEPHGLVPHFNQCRAGRRTDVIDVARRPGRCFDGIISGHHLVSRSGKGQLCGLLGKKLHLALMTLSSLRRFGNVTALAHAAWVVQALDIHRKPQRLERSGGRILPCFHKTHSPFAYSRIGGFSDSSMKYCCVQSTIFM
jgi:hypothetical protein